MFSLQLFNLVIQVRDVTLATLIVLLKRDVLLFQRVHFLEKVLNLDINVIHFLEIFLNGYRKMLLLKGIDLLLESRDTIQELSDLLIFLIQYIGELMNNGIGWYLLDLSLFIEFLLL